VKGEHCGIKTMGEIRPTTACSALSRKKRKKKNNKKKVFL